MRPSQPHSARLPGCLPLRLQGQLRLQHSRREYLAVIRYFWPRLLVTSLAWLLNDFAVSRRALGQVCFCREAANAGAVAATHACPYQPAALGPALLLPAVLR